MRRNNFLDDVDDDEDDFVAIPLADTPRKTTAVPAHSSQTRITTQQFGKQVIVVLVLAVLGILALDAAATLKQGILQETKVSSTTNLKMLLSSNADTTTTNATRTKVKASH